jgi:hypothetical protein
VLGGVPHDAVWFVDTEFQHPDGERDQRPICLAAKELYSGNVIRLWEDDLRRMTRPPFDVGERSIVVAYGAFAELGTFTALGWPRPKRLLDLHPEFRCQDNDAPKKSGSLLAALTKFDLPHMSVMDKEANRKLFIEQNRWNEAEKRRGTRYCETDVDGMMTLWPKLLPRIENIEEAFLRSEYVAALTDVSRNGIMMDVPVVKFMQSRWDPIKEHLTAEAHRQYGVFPEGKWSNDAAEQYLDDNHMLDAWPPTEKTGRPAFDKDTLKEMCRLYPQLNLLREAKGAVGKVRPVDFDIGSDGRCRSPLYAFGTITGRNAPRRFPFAPSIWTRSFIRPFAGRAIDYLDFSGQEIALGAAYSGDRRMQHAYESGDFYLATAKQFGIAPADATEHHPAREVAKTLCLGINYGMTAVGLAYRLNIGFAEAEDLLAKHRAAYPDFWAYSDAMVNAGMFNGRLVSSFGWQLQVTEGTSSRTLRNFQMQAGGGDLLRLAVIGLHAAGIKIVATVHDAVLIEAAAEDIEAHAAAARAIMMAASEVVTGGFPIRVGRKVFGPGERYYDKRGTPLWNRIVRFLRTEGRPEPMALAA